MSSTIALVVLAAGLLVATKGSGCGRTALDRDPYTLVEPMSGQQIGPPDPPYQPRDLDSEVVFAVIGDYGVDTPAAAQVARLVASWKPDFVITTGDNNYPVGSASSIDANIGKKYSQFIGDYKGRYGAGSETNRFWPTPGNHDWVSDRLSPYLGYFTLPGNERYYDVARGLVHLYALDSDPNEPDGTTPDSVQAAWLKQRLAASSACYDVVFFHHPPYSSGSVHADSVNMRWPFAAWGADVVFAGHEHVFERLEVDGIPYFTVGLGGASLYGFAATQSESRAQFGTDFGALRASVNRQTITFDFIDVRGRQIHSHTRPSRCPPPGP